MEHPLHLQKIHTWKRLDIGIVGLEDDTITRADFVLCLAAEELDVRDRSSQVSMEYRSIPERDRGGWGAAGPGREGVARRTAPLALSCMRSVKVD